MEPCSNSSHVASGATGRFCVICGEVVDSATASRHCSVDGHARKRRDHAAYCVDCGANLRPYSTRSAVERSG